MSIVKRTRTGKLPPLRAAEIPALLLASFGLTGFFPVASGTVSSLAACVLYVFLPAGSPWLVPLLGAVLFLLGVPACAWMARRYDDPDPSQATVDEGAVMLLVMTCLPRSWLFLGAAFILFRFFDIAKPWPIRRFEAIPGGWGIMLDDLIAGLYAAVILWGAHLVNILPPWADHPLPMIW